ncbi:MAG: sigma-70 family RNA polymerase sigma factor [Lachnospiraceae bacterium]|nr:sigma-70 family RNA polymerase sigma factor [Lachnospiraceae bacterium]
MQQDKNDLLQEIYDKYQKTLRILARSLRVPAKDIDDVIQETIISYYEHYPLDWPEKRKKTMLGIILKNKSVDYFRKSHKEWLILDSDDFVENPEMAVRFSKDIMAQIINEEIHQDVEAAFAQLKDSMKIPAKLFLVDGIQEKQIAEMLGISQVACRARVSRAKKLLRKILGPKYGL